MQKELKITHHDPSQVNPKDFKFKGHKALRDRFRRAERIITVDDPEHPDDPIHFRLGALTLGEENSLHQNLLSEGSTRALVSEFVEKTKDGKTLDPEAVTQLIADEISDSQTDRTNDQFLRKIQIGIRSPQVSLEWLRDCNPVLLEHFHDTLDDLRLEQEHWGVVRLVDTENPEEPDEPDEPNE